LVAAGYLDDDELRDVVHVVRPAAEMADEELLAEIAAPKWPNPFRRLSIDELILCRCGRVKGKPPRAVMADSRRDSTHPEAVHLRTRHRGHP
jgi:hypothetical protein